MFPLGSVLFPHAPLVLHVFEPRYRALVRHCLDTEAEFGVVLIERGSEVGGGDVRFDVGTAAKIAEVRELSDERYALLAVGTRRLRVAEWLPDDPYPRARVDEIEERATDPATADAVDPVRTALTRAHGLRAELGEHAGPLELRLTLDPTVASFQLAAQAPIGPLDAYRLLCLDDTDERLDQLRVLVDDAIAVLQARLGG